MSDERISSTPMTPRCPVCADTISSSPGAGCRACGKTFPPANPFVMPDFRYRSEEWLLGYDKPIYFGFGFLALLIVLIFALQAPGILIPVAVLLLAAGIRTIRLATRPDVDQARSLWGYLLGAAIASFGVAALAGTASAVAFSIVCTGIAAMGKSLDAVFAGAVLGLIVAFVVFLMIFMKLWPRERSDEAPRSPDPEN
jgi:hypothetical protein